MKNIWKFVGTDKNKELLADSKVLKFIKNTKCMFKKEEVKTLLITKEKYSDYGPDRTYVKPDHIYSLDGKVKAHIFFDKGNEYINVSFPLKFTQEKQRHWLKVISNYFRELKHKGTIDETKWALFFQSIKIPYGSYTTRKQDLIARNKWIKKKHKQLKKNKNWPQHIPIYEQIAKELKGRKFGNLEVTEELSNKRIKSIIYSK